MWRDRWTATMVPESALLALSVRSMWAALGSRLLGVQIFLSCPLRWFLAYQCHAISDCIRPKEAFCLATPLRRDPTQTSPCHQPSSWTRCAPRRQSPLIDHSREAPRLVPNPPATFPRCLRSSACKPHNPWQPTHHSLTTSQREDSYF